MIVQTKDKVVSTKEVKEKGKGKTKGKKGKGKVLSCKKDERVGDFCRRLIKAYRGNKTHKEIAAIAKTNFPKSAVSSSHIAFYVCKMKEAGTLAN